jgi:HSP20 family protein
VAAGEAQRQRLEKAVFTQYLGYTGTASPFRHVSPHLQEDIMSIVRYRQWPTQTEIHDLLAPLLKTAESAARASTAWVPAVDIREEASQFVLLADLPGVDPAAIDVQMDKGVLSIKGERVAPVLEEGQQLSRSERGHGAFIRRFTLPDSVDVEGIVASNRNGVLEIRIPKRSEAAPRRIEVKQSAA